MQKIDVVFTIDKNYIQHFTVACTSLLENSGECIGRVILVHDISNNLKLTKSFEYFYDKYKINIEEYSLETKVLYKFKITHHISKATYFRLLLSEILPDNIDKVLFLDSDIIVKGNISNLLNIDFKRENNICLYSDGLQNKEFYTDLEYYVYAVNHRYDKSKLQRLYDLGYQGDKYFNAGIMYINLKKWRGENISKSLLENADKYNEVLLWWDQDVLNITFDKEWGELDYKYNVFGLSSRQNNDKIIHYVGTSKPWHFGNKHPYKHLYWKYLKMTPFKKYIPEDLTLINLIKYLIPKKLKEFIKVNIIKCKKEY